MDRFFAIVNPAAGGGRSANSRTRARASAREGLKIDVIASTGRAMPCNLPAKRTSRAYRPFLAVGGDGTAHEILNGVLARHTAIQRVAAGISCHWEPAIPSCVTLQRTGLRASMQALLEGRTRTVDLLRLTHASGEIYSFIFEHGFTADVAALTKSHVQAVRRSRLFVRVFCAWWQCRRRSVALRCDDDAEWDEGPSLFLTFNNSKYTGGTMLHCADADPTDGLIDICALGPDWPAGVASTCRDFTTALISNIRWLRAARCATSNSKRRARGRS